MTRTSIVVPTCERAHLVAAAINSILDQCGRDDQVIVVDDGSTDATASVLARYGSRITVLVQNRAGAAAARNAGLAVADCDRIAFLDSDDLWDLCHQTVLHAALDADPALDIVFGRVSEFVDMPAGRHEVRCVPGACCGALLASRSVFSTVGLFDAGLWIGEFVDWMGRLRRLGLREGQVATTVLHRRSHAGNMTRRAPEEFADYVRLLRRHLAAREGVVDR